MVVILFFENFSLKWSKLEFFFLGVFKESYRLKLVTYTTGIVTRTKHACGISLVRYQTVYNGLQLTLTEVCTIPETLANKHRAN